MATKNTTTEQGVTETPETKPAVKKTATKRTTKKATTKKSTKAKKATPKKAAKKTTTKKSTPAKKATKKTTKRETRVTSLDRVQAKAIGISASQLVVLRSLAGNRSGLSYREIEAKTGYYSPLTCMLRESGREQSHDNSLASKGFVKEQVHDINGKDVLSFAITKEGTAALKTAAKVKAE